MYFVVMSKMVFVNRVVHLWAVLLLGVAQFLCVDYCHSKHIVTLHALSMHDQRSVTQHEASHPETNASEHIPLHDLTRMIAILAETLPAPLLWLIGLCLFARIWHNMLSHGSFYPLS
jgi:hypothetical protein